MYKLLLTFRYLRRKLIPIFAMLAVVLCTAMVIVVISIMGGFLDLVRNAGRTLMGDVTVYTGGLEGFGHYEELIERIEATPEAKAATPIIQAFGLLKLPGDVVQGVQVIGIRGESQARVTQYRDTLFWDEQRLADHPSVADLYDRYSPVEAAVEMAPPWEAVEDYPAIVPGIEVSPYNTRLDDGTYRMMPSVIGRALLLTIMPITLQGGVEEVSPETARFIAVNEFNSGVFEVDSRRVFIPFDVAQRMMHMEATRRVARNPDGSVKIVDGEVVVAGQNPARATEVHVRAAEGVSPDELREAVERVYADLAEQYMDLPPPGFMLIETWEQRQAQFLAAVENEKGLMTVLFGIISLVAVVMIGVVFYMIVLEKTRDIGILRSLGASQAGVASIFLSFGAVIGILGAGAGTGIAWLIVTYINEIHAWLGDGLGVAVFVAGLALAGLLLGAVLYLAARLVRAWAAFPKRPGGRVLPAILSGGAIIGLAAAFLALGLRDGLWGRLNDTISIVIWDRSVYFFSHIPSRVDWSEVAVIVAVAIVASIAGAAIPAYQAARVDPVESLRYE